jgi:RND family efflux transporter MFP subunit
MKTLLQFCHGLALSLAALICLLPVQSAPAQTLSAIGITEPILDSTLGTPVAGILAARKFAEGDFVKAGDVLIELDNALEELEVARREVVLEPLQTDYEASKFLFEQPKSSVSKELLDKKHAEYKVALAEYELAKEQVRKRSILAPFDGVITEIYLQLGEGCQMQQPVLRLVDTRRCYFLGNVEARAGHTLRVGQSVDLEIESSPVDVTVRGQISFVSPVVDPASGLLRVKVVFDNPEGQIRPGVTGRMIFQEVTSVSARN